MEKPPARSVPQLIQDLQLEAERLRRKGSRSRPTLYELARAQIGRPSQIIDWAKRNRRWSFTLAEMIKEPGSRPDDLATHLLVAIVLALEEERELLGDESDGISPSAFDALARAE